MGRPNKVRYREDRDAWVTKIDGQLHTLAKGKRNRAEATRALHALLAAKAKGQATPTRSISVGELCDRLWTWTRDHRSALTAEWYQRHLQAFVNWAGYETIANTIRPFHVSEWVDGQGWGQSTRHGAITAVKRAFRWGHRQGYLESDPLAALDKPGIRRREAILGPEDQRRVLGSIDGPLRDYLATMYETGCRPSEVARIEAVHVVGDTIVMAGKTTRKTRKPRVIYLTPVVAEIVARLASANPDGPIFRNTRGRPWTRNALAQAMQRVRSRLGLGPECTAESLRHGWVTDAKLRLPNSVVAELAGHASTAMVDAHYGHVNLRRAELAQAASSVRSPVADTAAPPASASSPTPHPDDPAQSGTPEDSGHTPPPRS